MNQKIIDSKTYLSETYTNSFTINKIMNIQLFALKISQFVELVNYWSQILGYVVYMCDNHTLRKKIITNLFDENCSELTHVETFNLFLLECGYTQESNKHNNNYIILKYKQLLKSYVEKYSFEECCCILGSIEYVYHMMSGEINKYFCLHIGNMPKFHYNIHEILDVSHATDLFECSNEKSLTKYFLDIGANWIINCLTELLFDKPLFAFTYEDYEIEQYALNQADNLEDGLMILSGGDTMFEIAGRIKNLTAIDMNLGQINLVKEKIVHFENNTYDNFIKEIENREIIYDELFHKIKNGELYKDVFNNKQLEEKFGKDAVINTPINFEEYFYMVSQIGGIYHDWIFNRNFESKLNKEFNICEIKNVNIEHGLLQNKLLPNSYDFIQTSNITDWMNHDVFYEFCKKIKLALKIGGVVVMRRLASNNLLSDHFENSIIIKDKTNLYSETIIWKKLKFDLH